MAQEFEKAFLIREFPEGSVIIERANGEKWKLDAKRSWCRWAWQYEEKSVRLKFGYTSCTLVNDEGESCEFWTEEQLL
jgi:hypothetical protein